MSIDSRHGRAKHPDFLDYHIAPSRLTLSRAAMERFLERRTGVTSRNGLRGDLPARSGSTFIAGGGGSVEV